MTVPGALGLGFAAVALLAGAAVPAEPEVAFRLQDPRITESSGLAISRTFPGLAYTVNDSGDGPVVYAVDMESGEVVGVTTLAGVEAIDIEALAAGPDGTLLVGDIGDNRAVRDAVHVHAIPEPRPGRHTVDPRSLHLTYAGGPRNAEALLVAGDRLVVVSKEVFGGFYTTPVLPSSRSGRAELQRVADAPGLVTDATVLADGRVVVRTYGHAYVHAPGRWRVLDRVRLPAMRQGETIAAAPRGGVVYAGSEGADSPVYRLDVPAPEEEPADPRPPTERPSGTPGERPTESAAAGDPPSASRAALWWLGGAAVLGAAAAVATVARRR